MPSAEPIIPEASQAKESLPDGKFAKTLMIRTVTPTADTMAVIEKFVCQLYLPKNTFTKVSFDGGYFERNKPNQKGYLQQRAALHEAILRTPYQVMIWNNDTVPNPNPELPLPEDWLGKE